jgi:co-chaperonin GroES (HSP10)
MKIKLDDIQKIKLCGDRVLVKMDPLPVKSESGLIDYPNEDAVTEKDIHIWGTVVAVGSGKAAKKCLVRTPVGLSPGDRVYFVRYLADVESNKALQNILPDNHIIMQEQDVLCAEVE